MNLKTTLLAATVLAMPLALQAPTAQAQPVNGLYVGAGAGVNWLQNQNYSAQQGLEFCDIGGEGGCVDGAVSGRWKGQSRIGFVGLGSIGWGFGNGLRAEIEGSFRSNSIRTKSLGGSLTSEDEPGAQLEDIYGSSRIRGRTNQMSVMANALFDFDIGQSWIYPYVGAGVGYSWQRFSGLKAKVGGSTAPFEFEDQDWTGVEWSKIKMNSSDTVGRFAYQAIAGAAFPIAAVPGLSLTAEYRFFGTVGSPDLDGNVRGGGNIKYDYRDGDWNSGGKAKVDEAFNHSLLLGVRYAFNTAPAAVMAPPVMAPKAKSFLVFFDWDKSTLTDRARGIVKEAAAASKSMKHTVIEVNGYADTSGNPKYNMGLSMRRAQTVAAELVRNGVGKQEIAIKAFGDTVLLVPTGPGVREPQNRRVEIIIK